MAIIKKKDIKNYKNSSKKELDELVDIDGSPIEGDRNVANDSEIEVAPQQTTDDFASQAIQPNRGVNGYAGTGYATRRVGESKAEIIIKRLIENDGVINNEIPNIGELSKSKPIVGNKCQEIIDTISKNNLNGSEIASMLSYILANINVDNIPQEYRNILKTKL